MQNHFLKPTDPISQLRSKPHPKYPNRTRCLQTPLDVGGVPCPKVVVVPCEDYAAAAEHLVQRLQRMTLEERCWLGRKVVDTELEASGNQNHQIVAIMFACFLGDEMAKMCGRYVNYHGSKRALM